MNSPLFAVYGASGCGRGIMPLARELLRRQGVALDRLVFVDDGAAVGSVGEVPDARLTGKPGG